MRQEENLFLFAMSTSKPAALPEPVAPNFSPKECFGSTVVGQDVLWLSHLPVGPIAPDFTVLPDLASSWSAAPDCERRVLTRTPRSDLTKNKLLDIVLFVYQNLETHPES